MSILATCELDCGYGERPIISGATVSLAPGELVGVVGANGAGKSTFLKTLAGLMPALRGDVTVAGRPVKSYGASELARVRAYLAQASETEVGWTVREVVRLGRFPHQRGWAIGETARDRGAIDEALEVTGLADLQQRYVETLSGGQRQRVHLARALAQQSPLLLLDEPTAHLDLGHQLEFFRLVREAALARQIAVVAVLHDLNLAAQFCHRLWVVEGGDPERPGAIIADGAPEAILFPELVARAFDLAVQVRHHPDTGLPYLLPVDHFYRHPEVQGLRVHIVAGGGAGERLIPSLHRLGFRLSVGALNLLDSDHTLASRLGVPVAAEAPFSNLSEPTMRELEAMLADAEHIIVADVAWGSGNLANLRLLCEMATSATIWTVDPPPAVQRDFTGGVATAMMGQLRARGARALTQEQLISSFRNLLEG